MEKARKAGELLVCVGDSEVAGVKKCIAGSKVALLKTFQVGLS